MYTSIDISRYAHAQTHTHTHSHTPTHMHVYMRRHLHVYACICVYVCMYVWRVCAIDTSARIASKNSLLPAASAPSPPCRRPPRPVSASPVGSNLTAVLLAPPACVWPWALNPLNEPVAHLLVNRRLLLVIYIHAIWTYG